MGEPGARPSASGEFSNVWKLTDETGRVFAAKSLYISQCVPIEELHKVCGRRTLVLTEN